MRSLGIDYNIETLLCHWDDNTLLSFFFLKPDVWFYGVLELTWATKFCGKKCQVYYWRG